MPLERRRSSDRRPGPAKDVGLPSGDQRVQSLANAGTESSTNLFVGREIQLPSQPTSELRVAGAWSDRLTGSERNRLWEWTLRPRILSSARLNQDRFGWREPDAGAPFPRPRRQR